MDALPPIPVPLSTRWREFRMRVLPLFSTLAVAGAAVLFWIEAGQSRDFPGIAEGIRVSVSSPQAGSLEQLLVQPFQIVQAGDPVALVIPGDPRAALDLLQTELQLARLSLEPTTPEQNALDFERLRFDLLRTKTELAIARVELLRIENQVDRQTPLFKEKLVSEDLYDLTVKTRDSVQAEVQEKSNAVAQMEERLEALRPLGEPLARGRSDPVLALLSSLTARHQAAITNWGPITLTAPISGMVSAVQRQPGEHVLEGEPFVYISSQRADRVVGYLRQPYPVKPEAGMQALLTTREWRRHRFFGTVSQVGAQLEFITNALAYLRPGAIVDSGLPIAIDLPPNAGIRPGEIIDIEIREVPLEQIPPMASQLARDAGASARTSKPASR